MKLNTYRYFQQDTRSERHGDPVLQPGGVLPRRGRRLAGAPRAAARALHAARRAALHAGA